MDRVRDAASLVIFDCDGVLVDSEPISNRVLAESVNAIGLPITIEETVATFMGRSLTACVTIIEERLGRPVPADFVDTFRDRSFDAFRRELRAVDGVQAALDRIDLPYCVASSGPHEKIRLTLGLTGLLPRFEGRIFSAYEVERSKPHPDLFLHAARAMGVEPAGCVVVEDSVFGIQAALAAGMRVFGFVGMMNATALAAAGAPVFHAMDELPALISGRAKV